MRKTASTFLHTWSSIPPTVRGRWLALGTAIVSLAVYIATLAPSLTFENNGADGGDLIAAARTLGVPHPTGYPTYTLLAWLMSHLPLGTIAYRVNLLSALCAALSVGLLCRTAQHLWADVDHGQVLSVATALALAFSSLLWSQAVISEVYTLLVLFAAIMLWLLVRWQRGGSDRLLWLAGLILGLGLGNHLTLVFVLPAVLVGLWTERRRWFRASVLLPAAGLCVAGLSIYAYLPLAAAHHPPVNWGNPRTWKQFLWVVTARQYQAFVFGLPSEAIPSRIAQWAALLGEQFGWWGLVLILAGAWAWWRRERRFVLAGLAWMLPLGTYAFFYDTGDSHIYLLPLALVLALGWGEGARYLLRVAEGWRPAGQRLFLALLLLLPLASLAFHWQAVDLSGDWTAYAYVYQALDGVAPEGLVVVRGDRPTFAMWYALYAEGQRPDVAVVSGPLLAFVWYRDHVRRLYPQTTIPVPGEGEVTVDDMIRELIAANMGLRPVYATDPAESWEAWFDFVQEEQPIYRVEPLGD